MEGPDVAAHPGYVRMVLASAERGALSACRKFAELCTEEGAARGLIVARWSDGTSAELDQQLDLAARGLRAGFRLAVVAHGSEASRIARLAAASAARGKGTARAFRSEHQAAAWLMG